MGISASKDYTQEKGFIKGRPIYDLLLVDLLF